MLRKAAMMMALGASSTGCGKAPATNPNGFDCHGGAGNLYASPLTVSSDCWQEGTIHLVMRGKTPKDGETTPFVVRGKEAVGTLTRHDYPHDQAGCHMKLSLQDVGLECRGNVSAHDTVTCYRGDDPKPVCSMTWKVTEPYNHYHPLGDFPKYIEDHPED